MGGSAVSCAVLLDSDDLGVRRDRRPRESVVSVRRGAEARQHQARPTMSAQHPPRPDDRDPDDDDDDGEAPETPPDEPRPEPVRDPPSESPEKGPYTVYAAASLTMRSCRSISSESPNSCVRYSSASSAALALVSVTSSTNARSNW